MSEKEIRTGKISKQQKTKLLEIMKANVRVASGQFVGVNGVGHSDGRTQRMRWCMQDHSTVEKINGEVWSDWKGAVKKHQSAHNRFVNLTGNRPASEGPKPCEGLDAEVLEFFTAAILEGDGKKKEAGVPEENIEEKYLEDDVVDDEMPRTSKAASAGKKTASKSAFHSALDAIKKEQSAQNEIHNEELDKIINLVEEINSNLVQLIKK